MATGALALASRVSALAEARPLDYCEWTAPAVTWFSDANRFRCWFAGNGLGKTYAHAAEFVWRAIGKHPYRRVHRPPVRMVCYGFSHESQESIMGAIWKWAQGTGLTPECGFDPGRGITRKPPRLVWDNGSILTFSTYAQSGQAFAGKTLHYQGLDEPCPEGKWGEIRSRTRGVAGEIGLTFTPTLESPPQAWVREKCESKELSLTQTELTAEALLLPSGRSITPWSEMEAMIQSWLPIEREMRCGRSWEPLAEDRVLVGFSDGNLSTDTPPAGARIVVGIDHGSGAGRQRAVVAAAMVYPSHTRVWVCSEAASDGRTTPKQDAQDILQALGEAGFGLGDVDFWVGDRRHAGDKWGGEKANYLLIRGFAEALGVDPRSLPDPLRRLHTPSKYTGSVYAASRLANSLFLSDNLLIHPRCSVLVDCIRTWKGQKTDPKKDSIDSLFYALAEVADPRLVSIRQRRAAR